MKTSSILKSAFILCALIVGLSLTAGESEISLIGYVSSNGQPLAGVDVKCSNSSDPTISVFSDESSTSTDADGFYQLSVSRYQYVTFKKNGFTSKQIQITDSDPFQQHDVSMSSSSFN